MKVRVSCAASALTQSSSSPASGPADCQMAAGMVKKVRPATSLHHGTMTRASVSLTASGTSHTAAMTRAGAAASLSGHPQPDAFRHVSASAHNTEPLQVRTRADGGEGARLHAHGGYAREYDAFDQSALTNDGQVGIFDHMQREPRASADAATETAKQEREERALLELHPRRELLADPQAATHRPAPREAAAPYGTTTRYHTAHDGPLNEHE
eukprot:scaffold67627_cov82-Phaeocystis_antarctica.AAC.4